MATEFTPFVRAIAAEIRAERGAQNLTQADVYQRAGLSRSAYWHIETERRQADASQLEAIASALGLRVSELTERAERRACLATARQHDRPPADTHAPPSRVEDVPDWTQLAAHRPGYSFEDELAERMDTP